MIYSEEGFEEEQMENLGCETVSDLIAEVKRLRGLLEEVSELLWGCSGDGTREPFTIEETIERLREFSDKALAWDEMVEWHTSTNEYDSQHYWEIRELMEAIMKEVSE
jgi:hypothetical protein